MDEILNVITLILGWIHKSDTLAKMCIITAFHFALASMSVVEGKRFRVVMLDGPCTACFVMYGLVSPKQYLFRFVMKCVAWDSGRRGGNSSQRIPMLMSSFQLHHWCTVASFDAI